MSYRIRPLRRSRFGWVVALTFVTACTLSFSAALLGEETQQPAPGFRLGLGDIVRVDVWKQPELSVSVPVRPDGMISLPLVGEVRALGLRPSDLKDELSVRFEDFVTAPAVTVVVEEIVSMKVFVTGRVAQPGAYDIVQPTRVLQAIALAGGPVDFAKTGKITILREFPDGHRERYEVNMKDITSGKSLEHDFLLKPGDTIYVP